MTARLSDIPGSRQARLPAWIRPAWAGSPRLWLLLGAAVWAVACGVDAGEALQQRTSAGVNDSCAQVIPDVSMPTIPSFSVTSPSTYSTCEGHHYVLDIGTGGQPGQTTGTGGATVHHALVVSYAGPTVTSQSVCEGLTTSASFYGPTRQIISSPVSYGKWLPARGACAAPAVDIEGYDQYFMSNHEWLRTAANVTDTAGNTYAMNLAAQSFSVAPPTGCSVDAAYMVGTEGLFKDQFLLSCDGRFRLYMQDDGNLVLAQKDAHDAFSILLWTSQTNGAPQANKLSMQTDGNLVIYALDGTPIWASNTSGRPGLHLKIFNDGNMKLYDGAYGTVWQTNTGGH